MDDNYQTYLNRVARMTLPEAYRSQVQHIQESSKFAPDLSGNRQPVFFPGYTVITPPWDNETENSAFYSKIQSYQEQLLRLPVCEGLLVPVPSMSFHLTLADLIWDSTFRDACEKNPNFETELGACITEIFQEYKKSSPEKQPPICWQMLGLIIMPRAVGVCLVPQDETCYEQVIHFRRLIYQNPKLMALGIEQHYHFTAHVTLGYFGEIPPHLDRLELSDSLTELNQEWLGNSPEFAVHRAELRKFDNMNRYYRESNFPVLDF